MTAANPVAAPASFPVAPDCVYVWRGFRSASTSYEQFAHFLGSVFVPACALLQPAAGLRAYLPTMVPQDAKPAAVPDQTALMFWDNPQAHDLAAKTMAVRVYQNLHGDAYDMARSKLPEVPLALGAAAAAATLSAEQPYFVFDGAADWMSGSVQHLVGARRAELPQADFLAAAYRWACDLRQRAPAQVDGALVCCGADYAVAWIHSSAPDAAPGDLFDGLAALTVPVLECAPQALDLGAGLWDDWAGIDLARHPSINFQFTRPGPVKPGPAGATMRPVEHFEVPHLALWKSCVSETLARAQPAGDGTAAGCDSIDPLMAATDAYCRAMQDNTALPAPDPDSDDEAEVQAYLSYLHHRKAHARIGGDPAIEAEVEAQVQRYKFGNPLWQQMFEQYYEYYWQYPYHQGASPAYRSWQADDAGKGELDYGVIEWRLPAKARVAIVGDIGTGTDAAAAVLVAALRMRPDAILHVGDVYFSGTQFEIDHRLAGMLREVQDSENIRVPFFTVPGNHEYFTGAVSYLRLLDSGQLVIEPAQRQQASYFCLRTADDGWQFLGLDTGYHGHYMNVAGAAQQATLDRLHIGKVEPGSSSGDPHWPQGHNAYFRQCRGAGLPPRDASAPVDMVTVRPDEAQWHHDKLNRFAGRSILLSHHQLYSALDVCGVAQKTMPGAGGEAVPDPRDFDRAWVNTGLWRQFGPYFGERVAAWIWGHEHNLGIFEDDYRPPGWPAEGPEAREIFRPLPKGRCAGHSAIPVQESEAPYAQTYPVPLKHPELALGLTDGWYNHGFQILDLGGAGQPARMTYYQIAGVDPTPLQLYTEQIV
jgi:hypothetical protein